ncbi:hypothetical protein MED193_09265 [Roseobacter sp. MED193]|nr:hypothetical protein MED193_09265 [Roseobacter sp. MED193]
MWLKMSYGQEKAEAVTAKWGLPPGAAGSKIPCPRWAQRRAGARRCRKKAAEMRLKGRFALKRTATSLKWGGQPQGQAAPVARAQICAP